MGRNAHGEEAEVKEAKLDAKVEGEGEETKLEALIKIRRLFHRIDLDNSGSISVEDRNTTGH